jgi:hypothetical protein
LCWFASWLAGLYWHWRVFSLYRSLIQVKDKFGYDEFSFQFQSPYLAKQLGGPMFRGACRLTCWHGSLRFASTCDTLSSARPVA